MADWQQNIVDHVLVIFFVTVPIVVIGYIIHLVNARERHRVSAAQCAIQQIHQLIPSLTLDPQNQNIHQQLLYLARSFPMASGNAYQAALLAVELSGGVPTTKTLALEIGRLYYSSLRKERLPTVYDENAILNDISARLGKVTHQVSDTHQIVTGAIQAAPPQLENTCPRCQAPMQSTQILGVKAWECSLCGFSTTK
jgi:hypothetical protein